MGANERYAGRAHALPKLAIDIGPGHAFQSLCAASTEIGLAANKWLGMTPPSEPSVGSIHALIALNNYASGQLVAILDGGSITAIRTAAMSAAAAQFLARADSRSIGFSDEEWEMTFRVNIHAMFYLAAG